LPAVRPAGGRVARPTGGPINGKVCNIRAVGITPLGLNQATEKMPWLEKAGLAKILAEVFASG